MPADSPMITVMRDVNRIDARLRRLESMEVPDISGGSAVSLDGVLLYHADGSATTVYDSDDAGLAAAVAAAVAYDVIWLPSRTFFLDFTVPAFVQIVGVSRLSSIIEGEITGTDGSGLENLTVRRIVTDTDNITAIVGPGLSETFRLINCQIISEQLGVGEAYAINLSDGGDVVTHNCNIFGICTLGLGYGVRLESGSCYLIGGRLSGTTDRFLIL